MSDVKQYLDVSFFLPDDGGDFGLFFKVDNQTGDIRVLADLVTRVATTLSGHITVSSYIFIYPHLLIFICHVWTDNMVLNWFFTAILCIWSENILFAEKSPNLILSFVW